MNPPTPVLSCPGITLPNVVTSKEKEPLSELWLKVPILLAGSYGCYHCHTIIVMWVLSSWQLVSWCCLPQLHTAMPPLLLNHLVHLTVPSCSHTGSFCSVCTCDASFIILSKTSATQITFYIYRHTSPFLLLSLF